MLPDETPAPQDPVLASLERLHARLDRMEARLDAVVHAAPGAIAAAVDTFDDLADRLPEGNLDARMRVGARVLEQATRPDTLRVLHQLLARMDRVEELVAVTDQLPGNLAMLVDTLDDIADRVVETGVPLHVRVTNLVALAEHMTSPGMVELVDTLDARLPALKRVLQSGLLDDASAEAAIATGRALAATAGAGAPPAGPLTLLGALGDADTQRALGFLLAFAKRLGANLPATSLTTSR